MLIQNENIIQPETHLTPVSATRQTGFSPRRMVFAVLRQVEEEEVQLPFQVLSANRQTCISKLVHFTLTQLY